MNVLLALVIALAVTAVTVAAMLLVRRRAPEGSYFTDGDRASGVFGVLATGFSVLLGFIIFLAFPSYDESRSGAEAEATIVAQQVQTAQFLPGRVSAELTGELICYARRWRGRSGTPWTTARSATRSTRGGPRCSRRSRASTRRRPPSSRPTTAGWTRPPTASRRGSPASTEPKASSRCRCGWHCSSSRGGLRLPALLRRPGRGPVTQGMLMGSVTVVIACSSCCWRSSTIPTATGSAGSSRRRWSGPPAHRHRARGRRPRGVLPRVTPWQRRLTRRRRGRNWQEVVVTVLLVVAALATSWSSYQATRWNGEQAAAAGRTNAIRIEAAQRRRPRKAQTEVDVATFIAWADADQAGDERGRRLLRRTGSATSSARAYDGWLATAPADERRRADDAVRDGGVPAGRAPGSRRRARRRGRGVRRAGTARTSSARATTS